MKKLLHKIRFILAVKMYQIGYAWVSASAVYLNNGIHPKHYLMKYHDFFVTNVRKSDIVLDVGCGNGLLAFDVSQKAKYVLGVDIVEDNIKKAKANFRKDNLEFLVQDITRMTSPQYDVVIMSNVLEHIKNRSKALKKVRRLAPKLLVRVPLITRGWLPLYLKETGFDYRLDPTHETEYFEEEIMKELQSAGFKISKSYVKFGEFYAICE